jgi:predicted RNase H-like HicB family nuclease
MTARDYLKRPYARRLTPDEDGGYTATIQEFPGLIADGDTAEEAISNLESAAESWIDAVLESGQEIPEPISFLGYSGKIALRVPRGLHKRAAEMASSEGTSLNQWLVSAISQYVGCKEAVREAIAKISHLPPMTFISNSACTINVSTGVASSWYSRLDAPSSAAYFPARTTVLAGNWKSGDPSWPMLLNTSFLTKS